MKEMEILQNFLMKRRIFVKGFWITPFSKFDGIFKDFVSIWLVYGNFQNLYSKSAQIKAVNSFFNSAQWKGLQEIRYRCNKFPRIMFFENCGRPNLKRHRDNDYISDEGKHYCEFRCIWYQTNRLSDWEMCTMKKHILTSSCLQ